MLHGRDISNWQGEYNWAAVKGSDQFAFCKATEGTYSTDAQFARNWAQTKTLGLLRGAYHFARPGANAPAQAKCFINTIKAYGLEQDDALVLDLEVSDGLGPSAVAAWAQTFCNTVQALTGKNCWIYTNHSFIWNGCCSGLYNRPLWIASPGTAGNPGTVTPWQVWTAHQYAQAPVDLNVLNGDQNMWKALVNTPTPANPVWQLAKHTTTGTESLYQWAASVNHLPSTVLRLTCEHSPQQMFTKDVAAWLNDVLTGETPVTSPMPKGMTLWYMAAS